MAMASLSTGVQVESFLFPPFIKPPLGATNTLFLGGAGAREFVMEGILISVMAYGLYLEDVAIPSLAVKWKGKTAAELTDSLDFYKDIVTGPYEKSVKMTMVVRLTGEQYSETARGLSIGVMKEYGTYTSADAVTLDKFLEAFKGKIFEPGTSVFFTFSPAGTITIDFSKDGTISKTANVVLKNKKVGESLLEAMLGKNGNTPQTKQSLASRLSDAMKYY